MTLSYLFDPNRQFLDTGGSPLTGGWLEVFLAYTDDRAETWSDLGGSTLNPEKIVLDSSGRAAVVCAEGVAYRLEVKDPQGQLQWTVQPCYAGSSASAQTEVTSEDGTVNVVKAASAGKNTFDLSISDALSDVNASIAAETVAREKADGSLAKSVAAETEARKSADEALSESIAAKQDKLKAGDNIKIESDTVSVTGRRSLNVKAPLYVYSKTDSAITLSCDISDVSAAVKAEAAARKSADEGLTASINAEETLRKEADGELKESLNSNFQILQKEFESETKSRGQADAALQTQINNLKPKTATGRLSVSTTAESATEITFGDWTFAFKINSAQAGTITLTNPGVTSADIFSESRTYGNTVRVVGADCSGGYTGTFFGNGDFSLYTSRIVIDVYWAGGWLRMTLLLHTESSSGIFDYIIEEF